MEGEIKASYEGVGCADFLNPIPLSKEHQNKLAQIIKSQPNSTLFNQTSRLLTACTNIHLLKEQAASRQNPSELSKCLDSARRHLTPLIKIFEDLPPGDESALDIAYWIASDYKKDSLGASTAELLARTKTMKAAVDQLIAHQATSGKKNGIYSTALMHLATGFEEYFPKNKVSKEPLSLFSQLITFWLNNYLGDPIKDPARHIEKILPPRTK